MIHLIFNSVGKLLGFTYNESKQEKMQELGGDHFECRHDWKSLREVEQLAKELTIIEDKTFVGAQTGSNIFDIVEVPAIGDEVSYGINGDARPDGKVVKVTKTFQVVTSTGNRYRFKHGSWYNKYRYLIKGVHNYTNPHV